jgi:hypothetical protein
MAVPVEIRNAKRFLSTSLLQNSRFPGIHGVGIGKSGDKFRLRVYVTDAKAVDLPQILKKALVLTDLPKLPVFIFKHPQFGEIETEVVGAAPAILAAATAPAEPEFPPRPNDCAYKKHFTSVPAGVSVWYRQTTSSPVRGTIGYYCKAQTGAGAKPLLLTCNHVIVRPDAVEPDVMRHGAGSTVSWIATLKEQIDLQYRPATLPANAPWPLSSVNYVDAAVAEMRTPNFSADVRVTSPASATIKIGGVDAFQNITHHWNVSKHGYATCWTGGIIDDVDCDCFVKEAIAPNRQMFFKEQIRIIRRRADNSIVRFAIGGDSGSLVFRKTGQSGPLANQAVGLLFAIGDKLASLDRFEDLDHVGQSPYALVNPIEVVLAKLGAKMGVTLSLM